MVRSPPDSHKSIFYKQSACPPSQLTKRTQHLTKNITDLQRPPTPIPPRNLKTHRNPRHRLLRLFTRLQLPSLHSERPSRPKHPTCRNPKSPTIRQARRDSPYFPWGSKVPQYLDQHGIWARFDRGVAVVGWCCKYSLFNPWSSPVAVQNVYFSIGQQLTKIYSGFS